MPDTNATNNAVIPAPVSPRSIVQLQLIGGSAGLLAALVISLVDFNGFAEQTIFSFLYHYANLFMVAVLPGFLIGNGLALVMNAVTNRFHLLSQSYLGVFIFGSFISLQYVGMGYRALAESSDTSAAIGFFVLAILPGIVTAAVLLRLIYKMWNVLRGPDVSPTPGKAVGFLFIPVYNIYWLYKVIVGFADTFNLLRRTKRPDVKTADLPKSLFAFYYIYLIVAGVLQNIVLRIAGTDAETLSGVFVVVVILQAAGVVLGALVIGHICRAVNAIHTAGPSGGSVATEPVRNGPRPGRLIPAVVLFVLSCLVYALLLAALLGEELVVQ